MVVKNTIMGSLLLISLSGYYMFAENPPDNTAQAAAMKKIKELEQRLIDVVSSYEGLIKEGRAELQNLQELLKKCDIEQSKILREKEKLLKELEKCKKEKEKAIKNCKYEIRALNKIIDGQQKIFLQEKSDQ